MKQMNYPYLEEVCEAIAVLKGVVYVVGDTNPVGDWLRVVLLDRGSLRGVEPPVIGVLVRLG